MLNELNWEPLASRRRAARLVMFYKIRRKLVEVNMPLNQKLHVRPTRNEISLAYHIPTSTDYQKNSFFYRPVLDWNCLPEDTVCSSTLESFRASISPGNTSTAWYSTFTGERESRPFVRSEGHADSRYGIVAVGITRLHFTLSTTRHGLESSTS